MKKIFFICLLITLLTGITQIQSLSSQTDIDLLLSFADRFLPFSHKEEEKAAKGDMRAAKKVRGGLSSITDRFKNQIKTASKNFNVPENIISAVIITESGGNELAENPNSSAKGLMQIVDGTFQEIQRELKDKRIHVQDALNPNDNIVAGTYYLNKMFTRANNLSGGRLDRNHSYHWAKALRYYFAGPYYESLGTSYDTEKKTVVLVYNDRFRMPITDPDTYAEKVLRYAILLNDAEA
jgi:soluble lytic murein transglycosylase-like protein